MTVYAVFREGVYRHECGGIFSTEQAAKDAADALAQGDVDDRHGYVVVPFELDAASATEGDGRKGRKSPSIHERTPVYDVSKGRLGG